MLFLRASYTALHLDLFIVDEDVDEMIRYCCVYEDDENFHRRLSRGLLIGA